MSARLLLTGAGGWIGRRLHARLLEHGHDVRVVRHNTPGEEVSAQAALADVVVHAGGRTEGSRAELLEGNVRQALELAQGCARTENTVVHLSSAKVYGWDPTGQAVCAEDAAIVLSDDRYSASKKIAEDVLSVGAAGSVLLRISNVYGEGIPARYIVGQMLDTASRDGRIEIECSGASRRDFVHLDDVVGVVERVVARALAEPVAGRHVYNVSAGRQLTLLDVAHQFAELLRTEIRTGHAPPRLAPSLPNDKALRTIATAGFRDPVDGIRETLQRWREEPWILR